MLCVVYQYIGNWKLIYITDSNTPKLTVTATATAESIIHSAQATYAAHEPQAGTQTNIHISTIVAKPIGIVPRNSEFVASCIMTVQISGHIVYLMMLVMRAKLNKHTLSTKKMMER